MLLLTLMRRSPLHQHRYLLCLWVNMFSLIHVTRNILENIHPACFVNVYRHFEIKLPRHSKFPFKINRKIQNSLHLYG